MMHESAMAAGPGRGDSGGNADLDLREMSRSGPVHFVGIAGAGVSALAELVLRAGGRVTGCDLRPGSVGAALESLGADIVVGHDPSHVADAVAVVTTAAVPKGHPELRAARDRGIPVLKRAAALGALVNRGRVVGIAGTHGKTTTTAMTTAVFAAAGLDPTGFVGGRVAAWGGGLRPGADRIFVVEADEYDRSFHQLRPNVAIVTTVEPDHMDIFSNLEEVEEAFREFLKPVPDDGLIAACVDDDGAGRLLSSTDHRAELLGYGLGEGARLRAVDVEAVGRASRFRVIENGRELGRLGVGAPGLHNVRNALAAFAAGRHMGVELKDARNALEEFEGVDRRFQELGEGSGVVVVDDYAHHPTEVRVTLEAARQVYPERRVVVAFQPHLYTRTRDFHTEFGRALALADSVWVTDVYPAREEPIPAVTGELVADAAREAGANVTYHPEIDTLPSALLRELSDGDVLLALGAGTINLMSSQLLARLRGSEPGKRAPEEETDRE